MTFVIITGGIDRAAGSTLVAIGAASMMMIDIGPKGFLGNLGISGLPAHGLTIIFALLMGLVLGTLTGLLITKGRIAPFVATLGTMKILRSVTSISCRVQSQGTEGLFAAGQRSIRWFDVYAHHILAGHRASFSSMFRSAPSLGARLSRWVPMKGQLSSRALTWIG